MKKSETITVDDIDQANLDIAFVHAFVDMLYSIDGDKQLDGLKSGTVSSMCHESLVKIERLKAFIDSTHANTLPKDIMRAKAAA